MVGPSGPPGPPGFPGDRGLPVRESLWHVTFRGREISSCGTEAGSMAGAGDITLGLALTPPAHLSPHLRIAIWLLFHPGGGAVPCFSPSDSILECFPSLSLCICFLISLSPVSFLFLSLSLFITFSLPPSISVCLVFCVFSPCLSLHLSAFTLCLSASLPLYFSLSPPSPIFCSISLSPSLCVSLPLSGPCWPPRHPWHRWDPGSPRHCDHDTGKRETGWHSLGEWSPDPGCGHLL